MFISDPPAGMKLDMSLVKQLTGGDSVTGRLLNKGFVTFNSACSIWIAVNNPVEFSECEASFMERRYLELPCFTRYLLDVTPDPARGLFLRDENHAAAMQRSTQALIWLIINEPLVELSVPPSVQEASAETIARADAMGTRFRQMYEPAGPTDHVSSDELCRELGGIAPQKLKSSMVAWGYGGPRDVRPRGSRNCKGYSGLKRKAACDPENDYE